MIKEFLIIVMTAAGAQQSEWKDVADALEAKHSAEAKVMQLVAAPEITDAKVILSEMKPTHVAFVMRPEEVDFKTTVAMKRMMRELDEDPYDDAVWGIVTGPTAADAKRIASSSEPKSIHAALTTTGISDDFIERFYCLSDAYPEGCWRIKAPDGTVSHHSTTGDVDHVFKEGWNTIDPDFILTASHATEFNLEMPFSRGNLTPPIIRALKAPEREKVWLAAGNCLIADNLNPTNNMVMTALGFGKCNQFVGYIATTWFGEIGWGTLGNFSNGMSLVEAYHEANRKIIEELEETVTNAKDFKPVFENARDYDRLFVEVRKFPWKSEKKLEDPQKFVGRLWDRDATVFYGDPMHKVYRKVP